jgi:hypothetical protein
MRGYFMKNLILGVTSFFLIGVSSIAEANTYADIGDVDKVKGDVLLTSEAQDRKVAEGYDLFEGETVITKFDSVLKAILSDGGQLSITPNSELQLTKYLLNSESPTGGIVLNKGAFRMVSGKINKIENGSLKIETPLATLGIRGTDFFAEQDADKLKVVLIDNGLVEVAANSGETVLLNEPMTYVSLEKGTGISDIKPFPPSELNKINDNLNTDSSSWYIQMILFSALFGYLALIYILNKRSKK